MAILQQPSSAIVTATSWANKVQKQVGPALQSAQAVTVSAFKTFLGILDRYPPLKVLQAFVFALVAFSAIPLSVFGGFAVTSGAFVFGTAAAGIALVQGSVVAIGGFFLFWALVAAVFCAGFIAFWFSVGFFGLKAAKKLSK